MVCVFFNSSNFLQKSLIIILSIFILLLVSISSVSALNEDSGGVVSSDKSLDSLEKSEFLNLDLSIDCGGESDLSIDCGGESDLSIDCGGESDLAINSLEINNVANDTNVKYSDDSSVDNCSDVNDLKKEFLSKNFSLVSDSKLENISDSSLNSDSFSVYCINSDNSIGISDNLSSYSSLNSVYVSNNGNENNFGTSWVDSKLTIASAINLVKSGGTIYLDSGNYYEQNLIIPSDKCILIIGVNRANTLISSNGQGRLFDVLEGAYVNFINISFVGSSAINYSGNSFNKSGGAIKSSSFVVATNCSFENNSAYNGAAVFCEKGNFYAYNCSFFNNIAYDNGGAIYSQVAKIENSSFYNNIASNGGVIYHENNLNIVNSNFWNNCAINGGAIYNNGTSSGVYSDIVNCSFLSNSAYNGGVIFSLMDNYIVLHQSNFINNSANNFGGVICSNSIFAIFESVILNNSAKFGGVFYSTFKSDSYWGTINIPIINSSLIGNSAEEGAVSYSKSYFIGFYSSIIKNNIANKINGSTFYLWGNGIFLSSIYLGYSIVFNEGTNNPLFNVREYSNINSEFVWWGSNTPNFDKLVIRSNQLATAAINITNWVIMTIKSNYSNMSSNDEIDVVVSFNNYWNGSDIISNNLFAENNNLFYLSEFDVIFNSTQGNLSISYGRTINCTIHTVLYRFSGNVVISARVDDECVNLYLNSLGNKSEFKGIINHFIKEGVSTNYLVHLQSNGSSLSGKTVKIFLKNSLNSTIANFTLISDSNGDIYLSLNLSVGNYTLFYQFDGDENYSSSSFQKLISVSSGSIENSYIYLVNVPISKFNKNVSARLVIVNNNIPLVGYNLIISLISRNGSVLSTVTGVTDSSGSFSTVFNVTNVPDVYTVKCSFNGTDNINDCSMTLTILWI